MYEILNCFLSVSPHKFHWSLRHKTLVWVRMRQCMNGVLCRMNEWIYGTTDNKKEMEREGLAVERNYIWLGTAAISLSFYCFPFLYYHFSSAFHCVCVVDRSRDRRVVVCYISVLEELQWWSSLSRRGLPSQSLLALPDYSIYLVTITIPIMTMLSSFQSE